MGEKKQKERGRKDPKQGAGLIGDQRVKSPKTQARPTDDVPPFDPRTVDWLSD